MRAPALLMLILLAGLATGSALASDPSAGSRTSRPRAHNAIALSRVRQIIADDEKIVSPRGVQQQFLLPINGVKLWVSVRGRDIRNPILLVLHGGPGSPEAPAAWTFQSPWEDYFTVVEWDQRGAGKTYAANSTTAMAPGMSIKGMTDDAAQLVRYLRRHFGKRKIFLMGHSWGSVLGVQLAQRHPEWFYAYIGVGQIVNFRRGEHVGYEWALRQAQTHHNAKAIAELTAIAPYPGRRLTLARVGVRSKWEMYYGGLAWGRRNFDWGSAIWKLSPDYRDADLKAIDAGSFFSLKYLLPQLMTVDFDRVTHFRCPVIMFVGAHDYTTPHRLITQWFKKLRAPSKRLVIFSDSAHMIMEEQPGRFLEHLVTDALPYARAVGDAAPPEQVRGSAHRAE